MFIAVDLPLPLGRDLSALTPPVNLRWLPASFLQLFLRNHAAEKFGTLEVTVFTLYHSILHPGGAEPFPFFPKNPQLHPPITDLRMLRPSTRHWAAAAAPA